MIELTEKDIRELKLIEIDLLKEFIRICDDNNLKYYVIGGTLLGTIRHKGFIPWDDDIDVAMPRKDYEQFKRVATKQLPEYYFLQWNGTDKCYPRNTMKLRDSRTTFVESMMQHFDMNHGVFIDIFPLDYYSNNFLIRSFKQFQERLLHFRIRKELDLTAENKKNVILEYLAKIIGTLSIIFYPTLNDAVTGLENNIFNTDKSRWIGNKLGNAKGKERVPSEWFDQSVEKYFENIKVRVPSKYDQYLHAIYGDYMELPPEEKRMPHHYVAEINLHKYQYKYFEGKGSD